MALALDASTPSAVTGTTLAHTTASFTPPVGSWLFVMVASDEAGSSVTFTTPTNSAGSVTWTNVIGPYGNSTSDGIVRVFKGLVNTSAAMTVSCSSNHNDKNWIMRTLVITGAHATTPVGAASGGRGATSINVTYTGTAADSWGWLIYCDWNQSGLPTAGTGCTIDTASNYNVAGAITASAIRRTTADGTVGGSINLRATAPTGMQSSYAYFEIVPDAASGISGSLSKTLDAATSSATGTLALSGSASATLGAATLSAAGERWERSASLAVTLGAATSVATGTLALSGSSAVTLGAVTSAATGKVAIVGSSSVALDAATAAATGKAAIAGVASATLGAATCAATGALPISGSSAVTLGDVASTATGTLAIQGALSATLDAATVAGVGNSASGATGQASVTLGAATCSAAGTVALKASAAVTLGGATASAAGSLAIKGSAGVTLGAAALTAAGVITDGPAGNLNASLAAATCSAAGTLRISGAANQALAGATVSAASTLLLAGSVASTLAAVSVSAAGYSGTQSAPSTPTQRVHSVVVAHRTDIVFDRARTHRVSSRNRSN